MDAEGSAGAREQQVLYERINSEACVTSNKVSILKRNTIKIYNKVVIAMDVRDQNKLLNYLK